MGCGSTGAKLLLLNLPECTHHVDSQEHTHVKLGCALQQTQVPVLQESNKASDNGSHSVEVEV